MTAGTPGAAFVLIRSLPVVLLFAVAGCVSERQSRTSPPAFSPQNLKTKADVVEQYRLITRNAKAAAEERREYELIRDGDFSKGKTHWRFHRSALIKANGRNMGEIADVSSEFKKIWQAMPLSIAPGQKMQITAEIDVEAIGDKELEDLDRPKLYIVFLAEDRKTRLSVKSEKGHGVWTPPTNGRFETRTVTFTVPEGAEFLEAAICSGHPVKVRVRRMSLKANLTRAEAMRMGLRETVPERQTERELKPKTPATERAKPWASANEIVPVVYSHAITVDGNTGDWDDIRFEGAIDIVLSSFVAPAGDADCGGRFKIAADKDFLYAFVEIWDDNLNFGKNLDCRDDSIEIYLSPLFSQETRYDETDCQIVLTPKTRELKEFELTGRNYVRHFMPNVAGVRIANGWGVEIAIPLKNDLFRITPFDMLALGFNIAYNDNDGGTVRDHKVSWTKHDPDEKAWKRPDVFGAALFFTDELSPVVLPCATIDVTRRESPLNICNRNPGSINVLRNGGFEEGDLGWHSWYGDRCAFHFVIDTNSPIANSSSLRIDGSLYERSANSALLVSHCFNVIPGEEYRLKCSARTDSTTPVSLAFSLKKPDYSTLPIGGISLTKKDGLCTIDKPIVISDAFVKPNGPRDGLNNLVGLLVVARNAAGHNIWFDEMEITRHIPGHVDSALRFDSALYAFADGEDIAARLSLKNPGTAAKKMTVKLEVRDQFYGDALFNVEEEVIALPQVTTTLDIPLRVSREGFFRVRARIYEEGIEEYMARETEFSIYEPPELGAPLAAQCLAHPVYLNHTGDDVVAALADIKTKSIRMFTDRQQEYAPNKYDFSGFERIVDKLNDAGIEIMASIRTKDRTGYEPPYDLDEFERYVRALVRKLKGKVKIWEIGNEPNLWMGWKPKPDPREYETVLRVAYNCVKKEDPDALVSTAGFANGVLQSDGYQMAFLEMDGGSFFDVFGFHPYDFTSGELWRRQMEETVATIKSYQPDTMLVDTESGHDLKPVLEDMEMLAKKVPVFAHMGIDSHHEWGFDKTASGYIYGSYSSSSPVYPLTAFLSVMYADANCLGEVSFDTGFLGYLFEKGDVPFLVVWREVFDKSASVDIPIGKSGEVQDIFGNDISASFARTENSVAVSLEDRLPVYVRNVDVAALECDIRPPATYETGTMHKQYETEALLLPTDLKGFFDIDTAIGEEQTVNLYLKNFSDRNRTVQLKASASSASVFAAFVSPTVVVPGGGSIPCPLRLSAHEEGSYELALSGEIDGRELAPLPVTVAVSGGIRIRSHGGVVLLKKHLRQLHFRSPCLEQQTGRCSPFLPQKCLSRSRRTKDHSPQDHTKTCPPQEGISGERTRRHIGRVHGIGLSQGNRHPRFHSSHGGTEADEEGGRLSTRFV